MLKNIVMAICLAIASIGASATIVAEAVGGNGDRILLHDTPESCVNGALRSQFRSAKGEVLEGCWRPVQGPSGVVVQSVFMDADVVQLPTEVFKKPDEASVAPKQQRQ